MNQTNTIHSVDTGLDYTVCKLSFSTQYKIQYFDLPCQCFPIGMPRYPKVPFTIFRVAASNAFFKTSLKNKISKCHQTLKRIAVSSPLGAASYICLLQGAASLKKVGKHCSMLQVDGNQHEDKFCTAKLFSQHPQITIGSKPNVDTLFQIKLIINCSS